MLPQPEGSLATPAGLNPGLPLGLSMGAAVPLPARRLEPLCWAVALGAAYLLLYAQVIARLAEQWWSRPSYAYGFLVPLFSALLVWRRRSRLRALPLEPSKLGLPVMLAAGALLALGSLGAELLLTRWSLLFMLAGLVLFLCGRKWLRELRAPLLFLFFMFPLPAVIYYQITFPLQVLASRFGVWLLQGTQLPVLRQGNLISLPHFTLDVVAACSGLRSLLSLFALSAAYGYLAETSNRRRLLLLAATPPLAIAANGARIALTAVLAFQLGPRVEQGFWHMLTGLLVFLLTVGGLLLLHRGLEVGSRLLRHA